MGLGTQDSYELAEWFIESTGTRSFPMLWDPSYESWIELGINGQPAGMLLAPGGEGVAGWRGPIPEDDVLELAARL